MKPVLAPRIAMVAGETSGDMLAGLLLGALKKRWPALSAVGIGGPRMVANGFEPWWSSDTLAVRGYVEVLRHYRRILGIRQQLTDRLLSAAPEQGTDLFIGVDAPDFNLALEVKLKARGVKTVHFICPSIWAWRAERVQQLRCCADHVLCIFPFEVALLAQHGIPATYVGHPLASVIPMQVDRPAARRALGLHDDDHVVAILPGSRQSEIKYLARRFFDAAAMIAKSAGPVKFIVPALPALRPAIEHAARQAGMLDKVLMLDGQSHTALAACDVTLIASGTATLEAALFKRPMVIAYNMHWLSWRIMRAKQLQPWIGLPNILCGEFVVPELLQSKATPAALAQAVLGWLAAKTSSRLTLEALETRFTTLHHDLQRDTAQLATDAIQHLLEG